MQDNSKHSYDPELVDRGWSLLEKQLDEVLPQKPKRRFAWFWLPLLLGFGVLAGAGWYITIQDTSTMPQAPLASELNESVVAQRDQFPPNHLIDTKTNAATVQAATPSSTSSTTINSSIQSTEMALNVSTPAAEINTEYIASDPDQVSSILAFEEVSNVTISTVVEFNKENSVVPELTSKPRVILATSILPPPTLTLLEETSTTVALGEPKLLIKNKQNWRYYAEGQLTIALGKQAGLLGLGAGVERKLGKSWNLGLSLAYERSQRKLSTNDIVYNRSQAEVDLVNSNYTPAYNINQAYRAVSYDRLKAELQAHYQLKPRWRVGGGLSFAYYRQALFNTNEVIGFEPVQGVGNPVGVLSDERFNLFEELVSVYEFDANSNATVGPYPLTPNRWQLAGILSVQYQISQHWAINMNYRHDLTEWQTTNTDLGTPSFAQFGLRYYFK